MNIKNMSLKAKIGVVTGAVALVVASGVGYNAYSQHKYQEEVQAATETLKKDQGKLDSLLASAKALRNEKGFLVANADDTKAEVVKVREDSQTVEKTVNELYENYVELGENKTGDVQEQIENELKIVERQANAEEKANALFVEGDKKAIDKDQVDKGLAIRSDLTQEEVDEALTTLFNEVVLQPSLEEKVEDKEQAVENGTLEANEGPAEVQATKTKLIDTVQYRGLDDTKDYVLKEEVLDNLTRLPQTIKGKPVVTTETIEKQTEGSKEIELEVDVWQFEGVDEAQKAVKSLLDEAKGQLGQISKAKEALGKVYKDNKVVAKASRKDMETAQKEIDKIKNGDVKKPLKDNANKVKKAVEEREKKEAEEKKKKEEEERKKKEEAERKAQEEAAAQAEVEQANQATSGGSTGGGTSSGGSSGGGSSSGGSTWSGSTGGGSSSGGSSSGGGTSSGGSSGGSSSKPSGGSSGGGSSSGGSSDGGSSKPSGGGSTAPAPSKPTPLAGLGNTGRTFDTREAARAWAREQTILGNAPGGSASWEVPYSDGSVKWTVDLYQ